MTTGMIRPSNSLALVLALNCLQNSMMLTCAWPSAGPTGGAGVALPAAICNFTDPVIFLTAIVVSLCRLFHLAEFQLDRCGASEDGDHHLQGLAVLVDLVHHAGEAGEGAFGDLDCLVLLELHLEPRLVFAHRHPVDDLVDLFLGERRGIVRRAHKAGHPGRGLHHMPYVVSLAAGAES